jgi:hypothetical protein
MKAQLITTNFSAGEFSPELLSRVDIEKYNSAAKQIKNCVVQRQGGVTIRPPFMYLGPAKVDTGKARLVPFIYSRTDAYMLEFGSGYARVWKNGTNVLDGGSPVELVSPYTGDQVHEFDFSQSADTMVFTHGSHTPYKLVRFSDTRWTFTAASFDPAPITKIGYRPAITATITSSAVGSGRTITSGAAAFLASDVGREFVSDGGRATITAFGSSTSVTADVTVAFASTSFAASSWTLTGSPRTILTPSVATPAGVAVTLTLSADGWRSSDVGSYVEVNGGLVKLTGYTSATIATGVIKRELTSTTAAQSDSWALLSSVWNSIDGHPKTCTFYQQRLWFANSSAYPQSLWGSRSGLAFDFEPGTLDDSAIYKTVSADEVNPIQYLSSARTLLIFGYGAEFDGMGGIEKPISQLNMQFTKQSEWGSDVVRPITVGNEILFAERGRRALRVFFRQQVDGYDSVDISVYSDHLLKDKVRSTSYARRPSTAVWISTDQEGFCCLVYNKEQNTIAMSSMETDGAVEWFATIPGSDGNDETWASVFRVSGGVTKRYIERLDWTIGRGKFDAGKSQTFGGPTTSITGLGHLEGRVVGLVGDDIYMGTATVTGGAITAPRAVTTANVGLPYEAAITLQAPEVGTGTGTAQAQAQSTHHIWVRLLNSVGLLVNGDEVSFRSFGPSVLDSPVNEFSGIKDVAGFGWASGESDIVLSQTQGMPWTILSVIRNFTVNAG